MQDFRLQELTANMEAAARAEGIARTALERAEELRFAGDISRDQYSATYAEWYRAQVRRQQAELKLAAWHAEYRGMVNAR